MRFVQFLFFKHALAVSQTPAFSNNETDREISPAHCKRLCCTISQALRQQEAIQQI